MSSPALLRTSFAAVLSLVSSLAFAQGSSTTSGLAIGLRTGYALPGGKIGSGNQALDEDLSDGLDGMIPLWLDVGYRINPSLLVGGFFQYGIGFINEDRNPNCDGCAVRDIAFGLAAQYHILPAAPFDPWVGLAVGYEVLGLTTTTRVLNQTFTTDLNAKGFQFLTLQFGGDFMASPAVAIGPFINFSFGQYGSWSSSITGLGQSTSTSGDFSDAKTHEWFTLGVRGQFNL